MKIIKTTGALPIDIKSIVGEMMNIEMSADKYVNGMPRETPVKGYPRITCDEILHVFRCAEGHIYIPAGVNVDAFEGLVINYVKEFDEQSLRQPHTISHSFHTSIRVKSALTQTIGDSSNKTMNIKRRFTRPGSKKLLARFTWYIIPINRFEYENSSDEISTVFTKHMASIFYDFDDVCRLSHNDITYDFGVHAFRGSEQIIPGQIVLAKHGNPLLYELNPYWRERIQGTHYALRNVPRAKVFAAKYDDMNLKPVRVSDTSDELSTDICSKCRCKLYGDNYVFEGSVKNPDMKYGIAVCVLCVHLSDADKPIEMKYLYMNRVSFPRTLEQMIAEITPNEITRDIYYEILKGISVEVHTQKESPLPTNVQPINYCLIGDKYMGVDNINEYLCSTLYENKRQVCGIKYH